MRGFEVSTPTWKRDCRRSTATRRCISPCPSNRISPISGEVSTTSEGSSSLILDKRAGKPDVVLAVLDSQRQRIDRFGRRARQDRFRPGLAGGEAIAGRQTFQPAEPDGVAGLCLRDARRSLAPVSVSNEPMRASAPREPMTVSPSWKSPRSTRPIESLPPCPICKRLDDLRERRAIFGDTKARAGFRQTRSFMPQRLEQPRDAVPALCRADEHRHHVLLLQFARKIVEDAVARRVDLGDQILHQRVVVIRQPFEHGEARFALAQAFAVGNVDDLARRMFAIDEGAFEREIDEADRDAVFPDRYLAQQKRRSRCVLQQGQRLANAPDRGVDLVDEEKARNLGFFEFAQDDFERREFSARPPRTPRSRRRRPVRCCAFRE